MPAKGCAQHGAAAHDRRSARAYHRSTPGTHVDERPQRIPMPRLPTARRKAGCGRARTAHFCGDAGLPQRDFDLTSGPQGPAGFQRQDGIRRRLLGKGRRVRSVIPAWRGQRTATNQTGAARHGRHGRTVAPGDGRCPPEKQYLHPRFFECPATGGAGGLAGMSRTGHLGRSSWSVGGPHLTPAVRSRLINGRVRPPAACRASRKPPLNPSKAAVIRVSGGPNRPVKSIFAVAPRLRVSLWQATHLLSLIPTRADQLGFRSPRSGFPGSVARLPWQVVPRGSGVRAGRPSRPPQLRTRFS